jgi:hypothetical protein
MSDKPMTPDEYLIENPTHMLEIVKYEYHTYEWHSKYGMLRVPNEDIDISSLSDGIIYGPDFPQSRKRVVEWDEWQIASKVIMPPLYCKREQVELSDGMVAVRFGKYIDAPSQELNSEPYRNPIAGKEPELSRFLPDGWGWVENKKYGKWFVTDGNTCTIGFSDTDEHWESKGLIPPSEGGGFQKHTPGDPMPCDGELEIDALLECPEIETSKAIGFDWRPRGLGTSVIGWRPHYEEQN